MNTYFIVYLSAAVASLVGTALVIRFARAIGAVDTPGTRKVHTEPIPRIGGMAVVAATIGPLAVVLLLNNTIGVLFRENLTQMLGLLLVGVFVFAAGLVDDLRGMRARHKLAAQLAAAVALCAMGVRIDSLTVPGLFEVRLGLLGWPLTVLWIVGITNAINLIDGLDGLAAGISAVTCAVIAAFSLYTGQVMMAVLMLALLGGLTGFLMFNFNPARIFLGDCGSLFLGFTLAGASVLCSAKSATAVGLAVPLLAMGIPIFDTLFSMLRRALERRSLFAPDRRHIHHRLLALGLRQRHAVLFLYGVTLLLGGLGLFMMVTRRVDTLLVFGCLLLLLALVFRLLGAVSLQKSAQCLRENLALARRHKRAREDFEQAQLMMREAVGADESWRVLCWAAERLNAVSMELTIADARQAADSLSWRRAIGDTRPRNTVGIDLSWNSAAFGAKCVLAICFAAGDSLEFAGHCAKLFGRLTDEQGRLAANAPAQAPTSLRPGNELPVRSVRKAA